LLCGCGKSYKIRNHIPRFVESDKYVRSFSLEWTTFKRTQLDSQSKANLEGSRVGLDRLFGLDSARLEGAVSLDVGCGTGRHLEVMSQYVAEAFGVDLSESVETAQEHVGGLPNVHIIQADLRALPFRKETFDLVYSIGVLHHTPDTRQAFMSVAPLVKRGGVLAVWVYSPYGLLKRMQAPFYAFWRAIMRRLPLRVVLLFSYAAVPLYWGYKIFPPILVVVPFARHPNWEHRVLDTFDMYTPKYTRTHTKEEVLEWFSHSGFSQAHVTMGDEGSKGFRISLQALGLRELEITRENLGIKGFKG